MRKILTLNLLLLGTVLAAQTLDPTVRVTGAYKASVSTEDFPRQEIVLPDSVATFDTRFDYSVFEKPYRGSYDFSPYLMDLRPRKQTVRKNQFFLRAGAGYTIHPTLDAYWNPEVGDSCFNLSVYANHRSFWGTYSATDAVDGSLRFFSKNAVESDSRAGIKGRYDFDRVILEWDAAYKGLHAKTGSAMLFPFDKRGYNMADLSVGARSSQRVVGNVFYDAKLKLNYAQDNFSSAVPSVLRMGNLVLDGKIGDMVSEHHGFRFDFDINLSIFRAGGMEGDAFLNSVSQLFSVTPHYLMEFKKFKLDLGVNLAFVNRNKETANYARPTQIVYPDVTLTYDPWKQWATIFLKASGGMKMYTYSDMLEDNPYFNAWSRFDNHSLLDSSVERINLSVGVVGKINSRWSYKLAVGYRIMGASPLEGINELGLPAIAFVNYQSFYAGLRTRYHCDFLDVIASLRYQGTSNIDYNQRNKALFTLPPVLADIRAVYNYKQRIYAGLSLEVQGTRKASWLAAGLEQSSSIRPFWNLGLDAQYVLCPELSFWLHCDNLLFQ